MNPSNIGTLMGSRHNSSDSDLDTNSCHGDYEVYGPRHNKLALPGGTTAGAKSKSNPKINVSGKYVPCGPSSSSGQDISTLGSRDTFHDAVDVSFAGGSTSSVVPGSRRQSIVSNKSFQVSTPANEAVTKRNTSFSSKNSSASASRTASPHSRPRSGSWTGANESEEDIQKRVESASVASDTSSAASSADEAVKCSTEGESNAKKKKAEKKECPFPIDPKCEDVLKMGRTLRFYFMNPLEKWHAKSRFPWKLLLQIIKIVVVTMQLVLFAQQRYSHVAYLWDTRVSFSHMFIKEWDSSREVNSYPPNDGPLAVYTKQDFFGYLDYASLAYQNLMDMSVGTYLYHRVNNNSTVMNTTMCCEQYNEDYNGKESQCIGIPWKTVNTAPHWSIEKYLKDNNFSVLFDKLLSCNYTFKLMAVKQRTPPTANSPVCYNLTNALIFNNEDRDGQMLVALNIEATVLSCHESDPGRASTGNMVLNIITVLFCILSFIMCCRSLYRSQLLKNEVTVFFKFRYKYILDFDDMMEFCNLWYVLICFNDILIIIGTILKLGLESRVIGDTTSQNHEGYIDTWNICSLFLGTGNLLAWFGCLRYLSFFKTYNALMLTMKKCFPNVLRYSICILQVFAGYTTCGWLVLSPYHIKFQTLSSSMECLFSLINGDDMYATFSSTSAKDPLIWWFSRIYYYTFISLFIYVILSLFVAIIMDDYETVKKYYKKGHPLTNVRHFVKACEPHDQNVEYSDVGDRTMHDVVNGFFCCCVDYLCCRRRNTGYEQVP